MEGYMETFAEEESLDFMYDNPIINSSSNDDSCPNNNLYDLEINGH